MRILQEDKGGEGSSDESGGGGLVSSVRFWTCFEGGVDRICG